MPAEKEEEEELLNDIQIDAMRILPADRGYYTFSGSLTTSPCSEDVTWFVFKNPTTVSAAEIKQFSQLYRNDSRPTQPLYSRVVLESKYVLAMSSGRVSNATDSLGDDVSSKGPNIIQEFPDFSLVLGGPLFQLLRRSHLEGEAMELLHRRILMSILLTWVPLLLLSILGTGVGGAGRISFFRNIEVHTRFLVALPILVGAERLVHSRVGAAIRRFVKWRIVLPEDLPLFQKAIVSATKIRDSVSVELALLAAVYTVGLLIWSDRGELGIMTWYAVPGGRWELTRAGYWYVFVSLPLFQFILLRWYVRLFIWFRFLWQVNRIELNLMPTHPDRCGGLGFIGKSSYA